MNLHDMKAGEFVKHVRSKKIYVLVWYHGKLLCQPWNTERWEVERNRFNGRALKKVYIPAHNLTPFEWHGGRA